MRQIYLYTDGSCLKNPGVGGWACILKDPLTGEMKEYCGYEAQTSNNRMELTAVIRGLQALRESCVVTVTTDSLYVINPVKKRWVYRWQARNWMLDRFRLAKNSDLWSELLPLVDYHKVQWEWVKGHNGHVENERCDYLAHRTATGGGKHMPDLKEIR